MAPSVDHQTKLITKLIRIQVIIYVAFLLELPQNTCCNSTFKVYWNVPSNQCQSHGIYINASQFSMIQNAADAFLGNRVSLFYYRNIGRYPYIANNNSFVNGGIPQLTDFEAHWQASKKDVTQLIPPEAAGEGIAVIDWEAWRPVWEHNFDGFEKYRSASVQLAERQHPSFSHDEALKVAEYAFEHDARFLLESTLLIGGQQRPSRKWGYYGLPRCYKYFEENSTCHGASMTENAKLSWLPRASGALYPSCYFRSPDRPRDRKAYVRVQVAEAQRIIRLSGELDKPVIPYTTFLLTQSNDFYSLADLEASLGTMKSLGVEGAVLWASSSAFDSKSECMAAQKYVYSVLGPFVQQLLQGRP